MEKLQHCWKTSSMEQIPSPGPAFFAAGLPCPLPERQEQGIISDYLKPPDYFLTLAASRQSAL
jgi:hypothetical protein